MNDELATDVAKGLAADPPNLPAKYLYDARGSELFEAITRLPEYYPTRTEAAILAEHADDVMATATPDELVELGSGSSTKTRLLLDAMHRVGGDRYVPLDVSPTAISRAADALRTDMPWLTVDGIVFDFMTQLDQLPRTTGRRLLVFLGSTIGNLDPDQRADFFARVHHALGDDDHFLLGADLVKDLDVLVRAYDDAQGVSAAFSRNVLHVLNRELDGDLPVEAFGHHALWNAEEQRIEMWLRASRPVQARLKAIDVDVVFAPGEGLRTEISSKFTRDGLTDELAAAGLELRRWLTDERGWFAVALLRRA